MLANEPARHEASCIRTHCNPRPTISIALTLLFRTGCSFPLSQRRDQISSHCTRLHFRPRITLSWYMEQSFTKLNQKILNSRAVDSSHTNGSTERIALNQTGNHSHLFFDTQLIHGLNMLDRSSIVNNNLPIEPMKRDLNGRLCRFFGRNRHIPFLWLVECASWN